MAGDLGEEGDPPGVWVGQIPKGLADRGSEATKAEATP